MKIEMAIEMAVSILRRRLRRRLLEMSQMNFTIRRHSELRRPWRQAASAPAAPE
jgi:hypothetical protein